MTVAELITLLSTAPPDLRVLMDDSLKGFVGISGAALNDLPRGTVLALYRGLPE